MHNSALEKTKKINSMKDFYKNLFFIMLSLLCMSNASAQITVGKVYNFKNLEYGMSMASSGIVKTVIADTDTSDKTQLWLAGDGGNGTYTLRNLGNGLYLKGKSANAGMWPFVGEASATAFYLIGAGEGYTLSMTNSINFFCFKNVTANCTFDMLATNF